jgi:hypothetical protein
MYESQIETLDAAGQMIKQRILRHGQPLPYADVLQLWQSDETLRQLFIDLLVQAPYRAYRWETPPLTRFNAAQQPFEFVLVDAPGLRRTPDVKTFARQFTTAQSGIARCQNLGGDATMIIPAPPASGPGYSDLATFVRQAPAGLSHELWRVVGATLQQQLGPSPLWLSTAGGGVAWLHVRIDSRPKYYHHSPYKAHPGA